jgi:hypothetical protein
MMHTATVRQYSVSLTSWFADTVPFREAGLEAIARKLLIRFGGYGLRPLELLQREGDKLFDYDLTFSLFNRSGSFRLTSEGGHAAFQNARDDKDAGIISDCLLGLIECVSERRIREHRLEAFVHASLSSTEERDQFLARLGSSERKLPVGGSVLYFPTDAPFGESRFLVDRSVLFTDAVFLNGTASFTPALNQGLVDKAVAVFKQLCGELGLQFGKP